MSKTQNLIPLGKIIKEIDIRNADLSVSRLLGVTIEKTFIPSVANTIGKDLSKYKIIKNNQFACSLMQISRDGGVALSLYKGDEKAIMSPAYYIFETNHLALSEYLELVLCDSEFDREAVFYAIGGVRGSLSWNEFCDLLIDLPDIKKQQEIVDKKHHLEQRIKTLIKINASLEKYADLLYEESVENLAKAFHVNDFGTFNRGKNITSEEMVAGEFDVISAGVNPSGKHNEFNTNAPSITVSGSGVNAGFVRLNFNKVWSADCSFCDDSSFLFLVYEILKHSTEDIDILKDGFTGQQHVYAKDINTIEAPSIEKDSAKNLEKKLEYIFSIIRQNNKEIEKLNELIRLLIH